MARTTGSPGYLSGTILGRYRVGPLLGRGGMGEVYRAEDTELLRPVALKVLPEALVGDADRLSRFVQEARTASALNHPHLVAIYEIGHAPGVGSATPVHFIAMELVAGETLRDVLDRRDTDLHRLLDYAAQAADALGAAHAAGIVHRDLKPENLMVAESGYVKVLDFGLAKLKATPALIEAAAQQPTLTAGTAPGVVMGTVGYMSPEQAQGRTVDHRTDIFSFGCILYEAATGTRAFAGTSAVDTLHQIIHSTPVPIAERVAGAPLELQRIVQKSLQKDPDERYQSMKDIAVDLRSLRRQLDSGSAATVVQPATAIRAARSRGTTFAVAIGVVLAIAAAALLVRRWGGLARENGQPLSIQRVTDTGTVIDAVISPDGTYLAYVESGGGVQGLYLRQVNGARPIELVAPASVGFWGIAFARDGQSIYYSLKSALQPTGSLFQIPALGGTPRTILSDIDSSVTFAPDRSRIAFYRIDLAQQGASSIIVAASDGSNPHALVTKHPPEFLAPGFFVAPSWSPDGKRIAAFVRNSTTRDARLVTFDVATGAETSFSDRFTLGTFTAWAPDGSGILFIAVPRGGWTTGNGGQIFVQPFPSGPVRRLTSDVVEYRDISATADGRSLLSVGFDVSVRMSTLPYGGGDERRIPGTRYDGALGLAWAPDSTRITYGRVVQGERTLWSAAIDGSDARQLTIEGSAAWPAVSPDGRTLAYFGIRGQQSGIWRSDADGSNPRLLANVTDGTSLVFSRDGGSVYFTSSMRGAPATYRVAVEGGQPVLVAALFERAGISHDGRLLAGVYRENARAPLSLGVLDAETGKAVVVLEGFNPATGAGSIGFTLDDKAVLYTTAERANVWRRGLNGGPAVRVTNFSDLVILRFALSPDGRTLLLCRGTMTRDAFLISNFN